MDLMTMATAKKAEEPKEVKKSKTDNGTKKESKVMCYEFPFGMYYDHGEVDVSRVFEEGKSYSTDEISKVMLQHGFYEFSGTVSYDYIKEDKMLVVSFQKHSKG